MLTDPFRHFKDIRPSVKENRQEPVKKIRQESGRPPSMTKIDVTLSLFTCF